MDVSYVSPAQRHRIVDHSSSDEEEAAANAHAPWSATGTAATGASTTVMAGGLSVSVPGGSATAVDAATMPRNGRRRSSMGMGTGPRGADAGMLSPARDAKPVHRPAANMGLFRSQSWKGRDAAQSFDIWGSDDAGGGASTSNGAGGHAPTMLKRASSVGGSVASSLRNVTGSQRSLTSSTRSFTFGSQRSVASTERGAAAGDAGDAAALNSSGRLNTGVVVPTDYKSALPRTTSSYNTRKRSVTVDPSLLGGIQETGVDEIEEGDEDEDEDDDDDDEGGDAFGGDFGSGGAQVLIERVAADNLVVEDDIQGYQSTIPRVKSMLPRRRSQTAQVERGAALLHGISEGDAEEVSDGEGEDGTGVNVSAFAGGDAVPDESLVPTPGTYQSSIPRVKSMLPKKKRSVEIVPTFMGGITEDAEDEEEDEEDEGDLDEEVLEDVPPVIVEDGARRGSGVHGDMQIDFSHPERRRSRADVVPSMLGGITEDHDGSDEEEEDDDDAGAGAVRGGGAAAQAQAQAGSQRGLPVQIGGSRRRIAGGGGAAGAAGVAGPAPLRVKGPDLRRKGPAFAEDGGAAGAAAAGAAAVPVRLAGAHAPSSAVTQAAQAAAARRNSHKNLLAAAAAQDSPPKPTGPLREVKPSPRTRPTSGRGTPRRAPAAQLGGVRGSSAGRQRTPLGQVDRAGASAPATASVSAAGARPMSSGRSRAAAAVAHARGLVQADEGAGGHPRAGQRFGVGAGGLGIGEGRRPSAERVESARRLAARGDSSGGGGGGDDGNRRLFTGSRDRLGGSRGSGRLPLVGSSPGSGAAGGGMPPLGGAAGLGGESQAGRLRPSSARRSGRPDSAGRTGRRPESAGSFGSSRRLSGGTAGTTAAVGGFGSSRGSLRPMSASGASVGAGSRRQLDVHSGHVHISDSVRNAAAASAASRARLHPGGSGGLKPQTPPRSSGVRGGARPNRGRR